MGLAEWVENELWEEHIDEVEAFTGFESDHIMQLRDQPHLPCDVRHQDWERWLVLNTPVDRVKRQPLTVSVSHGRGPEGPSVERAMQVLLPAGQRGRLQLNMVIDSVEDGGDSEASTNFQGGAGVPM